MTIQKSGQQPAVVKTTIRCGQQLWVLLSAVVHFPCREASDLPGDSSKRTVLM
ncbi:hypothetical protein L0U88_12305 [Flavihumibacter sp. RY-1]|uniref:Uncharacterized protein n=1 Tax=Flavihumibacter fluminis TaxID=2909236 RepID=A0ABS9BJL0_9BACT|nr:hypothetical protein [Flavihumibacter fluminis]MCF1715410.1 hypothetical protein [Flavihumibacter fluminis]